MPSSGKTEKLALNRFAGSDKPKMDDFNYDNSRIDAALGGHLEDGELHLGAGERERYLRPQVETFSYTGDGETTREVALPFAPALCVVYPNNAPPSINDMTNPGIVIWSHGVAWPGGSTLGLSLSGTALTVYEDMDTAPFAARRSLNTYGQEYLCLLYR